MKQSCFGVLMLCLVMLVSQGVIAAQLDADVIVVGGGNAGLPTAIGAAHTGAQVIVIEKMPYLGGTLLVAGGQLSGANTRMQIGVGFQDSPQQHYVDIQTMGNNRANPRLLKTQTENAGWTIDWLEELGVNFDKSRPIYMDHHQLYSAARSYQPLGGGGEVAQALIKEVNKYVDAGRVEIKLQTTVVELVQDEEGRVIGVKAVTADGQEITLTAKHIVLATGGYGANRELLSKYHASQGANALIYVPASSAGDGLVMATALGADTTHMDLFVPYPGSLEDPDRPGYPMSGVRVDLGRTFAGDIWVNERGERFVNEETLSPDEREMAIVRQTGATTYIVFDQTVKNANKNPVTAGWNWDQFEEEASRGRMIFKANTLEELANLAGIDANSLVNTVKRYNEYVETGWDREWNKPILEHAIVEGPFYCVITKPSIYLTHGGLKVSDKLEVVHTDGYVIPDLYAVGEVMGMGQVMGNAFAGGMGNTSPITFGIMLGEELGRR